MRRGVNERNIRELLEKIKREIPNAKLRTTLLVGHPGEGDREFEHLYNFLKEELFDQVGVFCYSREEGTPSAKATEQVPRKVALARKDAIMKLSATISSKKLKEYRGKVIEAVVEGERDGTLFARPSFFAPSVDGTIFLKGEAEIGEFVRVKVKDSSTYDLHGEIVN
jgi:ribosomal protein S12 methylthiotransferase